MLEAADALKAMKARTPKENRRILADAYADRAGLKPNAREYFEQVKLIREINEHFAVTDSEEHAE